MYEEDVLKTARSLKKNGEKVLTLWSERARQEIPAANQKSEPVLRDALPLFLINLARALSPSEPEDSTCQTSVSKEHGVQRSQQGDYSLRQVLAEYFILQKTIVEVLEGEIGCPLSSADRTTISESIAVGIKEAGVEFANLQMSHLERSNEALEHFAHIASHDLQEPLRTIVGHLRLIKEQLGTDLSQQTGKSFEYVTEAAKRMKSLMDSLLLYSQVGYADAAKVSTDFNVAFSNALSNLEISVRDSQAKVTSDRLPNLPALPTEIERLFQNLIDNAIKFRNDRPPVIHVSAVHEGARWIFSVSDNGIGINESNHERIFQRFSRLHSKDRYPGSGIGLSVCKKVAELHRGSIWSQPNPKGGSVFKFSIPTDAAEL